MPGPQFSYSDGTLSVDQDSAIVTGSGVAWSTTVKAGDQVYALVGTEWVFVGAVDEVTSDLELTLQDDYPGSDLSGVSYRILRGVAWFTGAQIHDSIVNLLTELGPMGLVGVTSGKPDPTDGRENELRIDATQNIIYQKRAGDWTTVAAQLSFDAVGNLADRSDHDDEDADFVFFALDEQEFYVKLSGDTGDWSGGITIRGPQGGDRYDISFSDRGTPISGEVSDPFVFTTFVTFSEGLSESRGVARVAPTVDATYRLQKNGNLKHPVNAGDTFGEVTFAAGDTTPSFSADSDTVFEDGDYLTVVAPDPVDDTLAGVSLTITGSR